MFNFNTLTRFDGVSQPLPVLQPRLRFHAVVGACQQQNAVNIARQTNQLIAVLIAKRAVKNRFQLRGTAGHMRIREAFE
ncbi:hypothetical protein D3C78_1315250 [compost metagenome]